MPEAAIKESDTQESTPEVTAEKAPPLRPVRMGQAEYERNYWVVTAEPGITKEGLLDPEYWSHVSSRLKPWDRIEVRVDDGSIFAELVVIASGRVWARCECLQFYDFAKRAIPVVSDDGKDDYEVKWSGPKLKFRIIRKNDQEAIADEIPTKAQAEAQLRQYLNTIHK